MSLPPRLGPEGYMRSVRARLTHRQDRRAVERAKIEARLCEVEADGQVRVSWWRRLLRRARAA